MKLDVMFCSTARDSQELQGRSRFNPLNNPPHPDVSYRGQYSNTVPLPRRYNQFIDLLHPATTSSGANAAYAVFCHDDILITDPDWVDKIKAGLETYDVVGLAGGSDAVIRNPCLWHIMCPKETHRGDVSHVDTSNNATFPTHFGPQGRVLILDGLFLAFKVKTFLNFAKPFDESNPCLAHFYDIDFSLNCNKHKLKLGTVPVRAVHSSPGLRSFTPEWLSGQTWFVDKVLRGEYS